MGVLIPFYIESAKLIVPVVRIVKQKKTRARRDRIKELRQENKGMREEIRKIKISIDRDVGRDIKHSPDRGRKSFDVSRSIQRFLEEPDIRRSHDRSCSPSLQDPARFNQEGEQKTSGHNKEGTEG